MTARSRRRKDLWYLPPGAIMSARASSCSFSSVALAALLALAPAATRGAESVAVGGLTYVNKGLVGVGRQPADLRDKFGETFGSGSGLAVEPRSWVRTATGYQ